MRRRELGRALDHKFHVADDFPVADDSAGGTALRAEAAGATGDDGAAIDLLYMSYAGRHATAAEISDLSTRIANGTTTLQTARSALLAATDAPANVADTLVGISQSLSGHIAADIRTSVATVRGTMLGNASAHADGGGFVAQDPPSGGASDPLLADVVTRLLAMQLGGGAGQVAVDSPPASFDQADTGAATAPADPASTVATSALDHIGTATGETSVYGASVNAVSADSLASYFGLQLTASTGTPSTTIATGSGTTGTTTVTTPSTSTGQTSTTVTTPSTSTGQTSTTATTPSTGTDQTSTTVTPPSSTTVQGSTGVTSSPSQQPAIAPAVLNHIYEGFSAFLGRAPSASEAATWSASVQADGSGLDTLRSTVLATGEGQAYIAAQATAAYQQLAGRAPTGAEIASWQDMVAHQGDTFDGLRHAIIDSPDGLGLAGNSITAAFSAYLGRAPNPAEAQSELDGMAQGRSIEGVGAELFTSVEGLLHFNDMLATLYPQLLGHDPTQGDSSDWFQALFQGATYDTMRATLMLDPTSTASHLVGTVANDRFTLAGAPGDVVISAFDAVNDRIALDSRYAGINLLDATHASQVLSRDGETPNVLIRLDDHDTVLLHGVTLAQLSSADFVFG